MPKEMRVDPFSDAGLVSAILHNGLHHPSRIAGVPIALKKEG
jgi:hypothetical protein